MQETARRLGRDPRWTTVLAVTAECYRWPRHLPRIAQAGSDLGERMTNAILASPTGTVVLVGSDIPDIAPHHVASAFHVLARRDTVFGPSPDGGYWLVGLRDRVSPRGLFRKVRWSTAHALADTVANLPAGRSHALVDMLEDVDDAAAWRRRRDNPALR